MLGLGALVHIVEIFLCIFRVTTKNDHDRVLTTNPPIFHNFQGSLVGLHVSSVTLGAREGAISTPQL